MPLPGLAKSIVLTALLLVLSSQSALSRETRRMCVPEHIAVSDVVFTGKAITLVEPAAKIPGVNRYAVIEVLEVLKGSVPRKVSFVVSGYSAELNPDCCKIGKKYLFFAKRGYDVFELSSGRFSVSTKGKEGFLSATNGKFSTFPLQGAKVVGWPTNSSCGGLKQQDIYACIRKQTGRKVDELDD